MKGFTFEYQFIINNEGTGFKGLMGGKYEAGSVISII